VNLFVICILLDDIPGKILLRFSKNVQKKTRYFDHGWCDVSTWIHMF